MITIALLATGGAFALLAAVGIVRMPDLYMRMQAATKAATLGVACVMLASAVHFGDLGTTARALLVVFFLFLTAPVAAHTIARAAYFVGAPLWEGTVTDELRDRYEKRTHHLRSPQAEPEPVDRRRAAR
jgi:multicomponent Na+:H+ antiporter subunit G